MEEITTTSVEKEARRMADWGTTFPGGGALGCGRR